MGFSLVVKSGALKDRTYKVLQPFRLRKDVRTVEHIELSVGDIIYHDGDADNGYVWFYSKLPEKTFDYSHLGYVHSGEIKNLITRGTIEDTEISS